MSQTLFVCRLDLPPLPAAIPTVSQWGLWVMTVFLLAAGTIVFRPRRLHHSLAPARSSPPE